MPRARGGLGWRIRCGGRTGRTGRAGRTVGTGRHARAGFRRPCRGRLPGLGGETALEDFSAGGRQSSDPPVVMIRPGFSAGTRTAGRSWPRRARGRRLFHRHAGGRARECPARAAGAAGERGGADSGREVSESPYFLRYFSFVGVAPARGREEERRAWPANAALCRVRGGGHLPGRRPAEGVTTACGPQGAGRTWPRWRAGRWCRKS